MAKKAPSIGQIAVIVAFALSCMGILIYIWVTFGGPTPYKPTGYSFKLPVTEAVQLAEQSDVRISGVSVGKVTHLELAEDKKHAMATVEIDSAHAPIPADTRAILRSKTLLGEAYVELTPGNGDGEKLPEGGMLAAARVAPTVQLDEILRAFSPRTRVAFQTWMQSSAVSVTGRGDDLGFAIAEFQPTFASFEGVLRTLDTQSEAVRGLFSNGRTTFDALSRRRGELSGLIADANRVFQITGRRNQDLEGTFRAFPTFLDESKLTVERLKVFSENADPLMRQLIPVGRELSPTFVQLGELAPHFRRFFTGLGPVVNRAPRGLKAFRSMISQDYPPLLNKVQPFLRTLNPIIQSIDAYKAEITALFANATAATNGKQPGATGQQPHYLRSVIAFGPESLATFPWRLRSNRTNAYPAPLATRKIPKLESFETRQCTTGLTALLDPNTPNLPDFNVRKGGDVSEAQVLFDRLKFHMFGDGLNSNGIPAPACIKQPPLSPIGAPGAPTDYRHVLNQP